jgi:uncharacterized membrane protein
MYTNEEHIVYIYIIMLLLLILPILAKSKNLNLLNNFTFNKLVLVLNKSIKYQFYIGVIALIISSVFDKIFYGSINSEGNIFTDIFIETAYYYTVIGIFMYLPFIGFINLISFGKQKLENRNN